MFLDRWTSKKNVKFGGWRIMTTAFYDIYPTKTLDIVSKIKGVGRDAEIVTNAAGGKQSKAPMAMHLIDPKYLKDWADEGMKSLNYFDSDDNLKIDNAEQYDCFNAVYDIARYMEDGDLDCLLFASDDLEDDGIKQITKIAKVLQYGASRYEPNNWRLIPQEEHINHALIHIIAHLAGDTQDDHIDHALCRLMMAYATEKSKDFEYGKYVKKIS